MRAPVETGLRLNDPNSRITTPAWLIWFQRMFDDTTVGTLVSGLATTVSNLVAHILDTTTHGTTGDIVGTSDAQVISGKKYGGASHYSEFEADGTYHAVGDAIGWKDIFFPMAPPKTTGAGNPTLVTWNGNLRGYSFAVNDAHDFDPQEFVHDGKEGSTGQWHIHFVSRTDVAADRAVKFEIEYSQANRNGIYPAPTVVSIEIVIPANTPALTHIAENIATFTTGLIASQMYVRLKRITATGTAPADDPVITGLHYHYEVDTVSSRAIFTK